jgi:hypothetical protein
VPVQPDPPTIAGRLSDFVLALNRAGRSGEPVPAAFIDQVQTNMTPTALIRDKTNSALFQSELVPVDAKGLASSLIQKGYRKFGCNYPMKAAYGDNPEGFKVYFLAFKAAADAKSTTIDNVLFVGPLFKKGQVSLIYVSDAFDMIKAALGDHMWSCNGFAIQQPTAKISAQTTIAGSRR